MRAKGEEILLSFCIKDQIQNMNLVIGCTVGCDYCYARNNVRRWWKNRSRSLTCTEF